MIRRSSIAALIILSAACGDEKNNGDTAEGPHCEDSATVVAVDEVTELGFAATDLLALAEGTWADTFTWDRDASTSGLELTLGWTDGEARFVDSVEVYPDDGEQPAIGLICEDRVEVDVQIGFVTDDGSFDESWTGPLTGKAADLAELYRALDPDALGGTYDMDADITEPTWDQRSLWIQGTFDEAGSTGRVLGQVSGEEECQGNTCSAWAAEVSVGSWGSEGTR